jgi:ATP-dependent Clp protease ATP-binding subunit ClpX
VSDKDKESNPIDDLQKQLQDFFGKASVNFATQDFMPKSDAFGGDSDEETEDDTREETLASIRSFNYKPREIKDYLDRYVVKQHEAKKAMAVAICDHYNHVRRCVENPDLNKKDYAKQNVILIGPTGVGKTYLMKTIARLIGVPFVKADATKFSETGYVGNDVEDIVRDLVKVADGDVELAQYGIIYIDEIDKIASQSSQGSKDVSGRGVQVNLLKLMEESDVNLVGQTDMMGQMQAMMEMQRSGKSRKSSINTRHMLFIVSGAFMDMSGIISKRLTNNQIGFNIGPVDAIDDNEWLKLAETPDFIKYGYEPEFIGRLPVRVAFDRLLSEDLVQILTQAEDNILNKYIDDFKGYGIETVFTEAALQEVAELAATENTGARGLMTVLEKKLRTFKFELPSTVITSLEVDEAIIKDPEATLAELLAAHAGDQDVMMTREVDEFVARFRESYDLTLDFTLEARKALLELSRESGKTIREVCEQRFKDLHYGLKLISQNTGAQTFKAEVAMVKDPDKEISRLVLESYNRTDEGPESA